MRRAFRCAGKRHQKWHKVHGTKRKAQQELTAILHQMNTGAYVEPTNLRISEYLNHWLKQIEPNLSAKTFERYEEIVRKHLIPAIGHHTLNKLQPLHIEAHYAEAHKSGRLDGKGGLSAQTVLHHHRVLHRALQQAVQLLLLARNPADAVTPPRPAKTQVLTIDEKAAALLLNALEGSRLHGPTLLAITTGLRRGEVLALKWEHLDLVNSVARVCQSLQQTNQGVSLKHPKSGRGRQVALPLSRVSALGPF